MAKIAQSSYEQHPLALQLAPGTMPEPEFAAFCDDIEKRGQQHPIVLFENKILDGWHRYTACQKKGLTPVTKEYTGDDPAGLVIALNVLRRKLGTTQRAVAGARLNLDYKISQDEASKRVGVSKLHINLVVQAINSKNSRVIKMLENPELTREQLYEEMCACDIITGAHNRVVTPPVAGATSLSAAGAMAGMDHLLAGRNDGNDDEDDDLLGGVDNELDEVLGGEPPSAGGKVIEFKGGNTPSGELPVVGQRASHPERSNKETAASKMAVLFKGMTEGDKISFMQLTWHMQRPLLSAAGLSMDTATKAETMSAPKAHTPSKLTSAAATRAAAKAAADAVAKAATTAASKPAKGNPKGKAVKAA